jgi:hypothetical protein
MRSFVMAPEMLAAALEAKVDAYVAALVEHGDERGHRLVVRNGRAEPSTSPLQRNPIEVTAPRLEEDRLVLPGHRRCPHGWPHGAGGHR